MQGCVVVISIAKNSKSCGSDRESVMYTLASFPNAYRMDSMRTYDIWCQLTLITAGMRHIELATKYMQKRVSTE